MMWYLWREKKRKIWIIEPGGFKIKSVTTETGSSAQCSYSKEEVERALPQGFQRKAQPS